MAAIPIPPHLVHTVFQYIFPPALPIPKHLLSRPLIERHHFLAISPSDPVAYLTWPSPHRAQVADALQFTSSETFQPEYSVRYSALDSETLLAHVHPYDASPLQAVFIWDTKEDSWMYHDVRLMPFPEASEHSLDAALARRHQFFLELSLDERNKVSHEKGYSPLSASYYYRAGYDTSNSPITPSQSHEKGYSPLSASYDYWAGYDTPNSPITPSHVNVNAGEDENAEAAYWASYGTVHGSADSTAPSPIPRKGILLSDGQHGDSRGPDTLTDSLTTHLHLRLYDHTVLPSSNPPVQSSGSPNVSPKIEDLKSVFSTDTGKHDKYIPNNMMSRPHHQEPTGIPEGVANNDPQREGEEGIKDAVRGIYRLWKSFNAPPDKEAFIETVKSALESL